MDDGENQVYGDGGRVEKEPTPPPKVPSGGDLATDRLMAGHECDSQTERCARLAGAGH